MELLPSHPSFPADLFTACLTDPLRISIHWYLYMRHLQAFNLTQDIVDEDTIEEDFAYRLEGSFVRDLSSYHHQHDRSSPRGKLRMIFDCITDCIAWNQCDVETYKRIFKTDEMVANLFRNFLLAQVRSWNPPHPSASSPSSTATPSASPVSPTCPTITSGKFFSLPLLIHRPGTPSLRSFSASSIRARPRARVSTSSRATWSSSPPRPPPATASRKRTTLTPTSAEFPPPEPAPVGLSTAVQQTCSRRPCAAPSPSTRPSSARRCRSCIPS